MSEASLHPSTVALVALAANIAANHPGQGLCQIDRLKSLGVSKAQVDSVIEIARHIRDEAAMKLDVRFAEAYASAFSAPAGKDVEIPVPSSACCTPTPTGKSCC
ncbi:hypothetical protein [Acidithiobacillus sulfuriphilus]|uniref:hypothetical protein n=1 Tax=Acidithiobacillus sulfuriphilus TaxID=1867749 RepID=UPI003F5F9886